MDRRNFFYSATALLAASMLKARAAVASDQRALNPPGIRTAGIRMLPVMGGKYKVWTKRVGRTQLLRAP